MPENELIIRHKGKEYDFELNEKDADLISDLTAVIEHAPRDPELPKQSLSEIERKAKETNWADRFRKYTNIGNDFQTQLKRLADLDGFKMAKLIAFLDLIELGELDGSQSNWALEFIEEILNEVIRYGAAGALHQDPRPFLASLSHYMYNYWLWVRDSRDVIKQHPEIFPAPPAEPEAAAEPASTSKPKRAPTARKRGRKAA